MKRLNLLIIPLFVLFIISFYQCSKDNSINFFTIKQDKDLGVQFEKEVRNNPSKYTVLDEAKYPEAYRHLRRIRDNLLKSKALNYKDEFEWKVYILKDDRIKNAFATPGGYLYFYTGLIKYLSHEAELAGVMAHEIAHSDKRHSTEMMTKTSGFSIILSVLLGNNPSELKKLAASLALATGKLKYSRINESEADEFGVKYMKDTEYDPHQLAGFFKKLIDENSGGNSIEFLSTHPSPENRVKKINEYAGSTTGKLFTERYLDFKKSLP